MDLEGSNCRFLKHLCALKEKGLFHPFPMRGRSVNRGDPIILLDDAQLKKVDLEKATLTGIHLRDQSGGIRLALANLRGALLGTAAMLAWPLSTPGGGIRSYRGTDCHP